MSNWRFYGREKEVARLACLLRVGPGQESAHMGSGHYVIGRRDVGKTELVEKTLEGHARNRDMMWFEFLKKVQERKFFNRFCPRRKHKDTSTFLQTFRKGPNCKAELRGLPR